MNIRLFTALFAFLIFSADAAFGQLAKDNSDSKGIVKTKGAAPQINQLAALLPNSDAVVNIRMSRLVNEAMPQLLATKPQYLQELNGKIDELKNNFGIDLRQFEQIAIGIAYKTVSAKETDFEPVMMARGKLNSGAFLGLAKVAVKGKYTEEKIGEKTIYIFTPTEILADNLPKAKGSFLKKMFDKMLNSFRKGVAVASYDDNTLVMGSLKRVREAFESAERVNRTSLELASKNPNAIMSFGANMPAGASQFLSIDNDELGRNIESIKQMSGGIDMNDGKATLGIAAKTAKSDEAQSLYETLSGLQMVGKSLLSGSRKADQQLYARMIDNAVITRKLNEVSLSLSVPKTDVDVLMGILLK